MASAGLATVTPCPVASGSESVESYVFTRYAGNPNDTPYGSTDGFGDSARFAAPRSIAVDASGTLYVADAASSVIRKITAEGMVTTFVGTAGQRGSADGIGAAARFQGIDGLAIDARGNLYAVDFTDHTVRKITPEGVVTTLAGSAGDHGTQVGHGGEARFDSPMAVAVDRWDNLYVGQMGDGAIRKVSPDGNVTILAGAGKAGSADGDSASARFSGSDGLAVDGTGNVYVADLFNHTIRKITPDGVVTTLAGVARESGFADGAGAAARFYYPRELSIDAYGNILVADEGNCAIRKVSPSGVVSTVAGKTGLSGSDDGVDAARFSLPRGVAVSRTGDIYVADSGNSTVRRIAVGGAVTTFAGRPGGPGYANGSSETAQFYFPTGIAIDQNRNVFVADSYNNVIRKITPGGVVTTVAGLGGVFGSAEGSGAAARFGVPAAVAIDAAANLYVANRQTHVIAKIAPDGAVTFFAGSPGLSGSTDGNARTEARFNGPTGIAVGPSGTIYVADFDNHTIRQISPAGMVSTLAGAAGQPGTADGTGSAARFYAPAAVTVDRAGMIYVADSWSSAVRKITPDGVVTTVVRQPYDGEPERLYLPFGIAAGHDGSLYIADTGNSTIRQIRPDGSMVTIGGGMRQEGKQDGRGGEARFLNPYGVAVDAAGHLYVADSGNNLVRKGVKVAAGKPVFTASPMNATTLVGQSVQFASSVSQSGGAILQWRCNGRDLVGETAAVLAVANVGLNDVGLYSITATQGLEITSTEGAVLGIASSSKVTGAGSELQADIRHPNGNVFDQVLLTGEAEAITADYALNQITRTSFVDVDGDIVQVEFSGPGTLSLVLDASSGPARAEKYNQDSVSYMKGHAGIVIAGATEQTNVSVFSVGKATAVNQALFKEGESYDGIADLAFIAILSSDGKFGGIRAANATFFADKGHTGIYAPGVDFSGPVFVGDVSAFDQAKPVLVLGSAADVRITGGDLLQDNNQPVQVSGITQLQFRDGSDSHGNALPAQKNKAVLTEDGIDVTAQIVIGP
ncbi:NHL repeat containing protein [Opitutus terrae PB90-1]|uniref:NHL repeat containing protein n=2 Tax=Opitutus terrae TaxID=107709 RepID=B2A0D6_OPITP|nr:NHL repeat containing protein [Opitutus terrae PB90-1]